MPYTLPDFNGALLNFRPFLKLEAPSRLGAQDKFPHPLKGSEDDTTKSDYPKKSRR